MQDLVCVFACLWVLQCRAVRCGVLRCVAACCSVLQCVAMCHSRLCPFLAGPDHFFCVLQCVAVCCSVLQCVSHGFAHVLQNLICFFVLQCVAVYFVCCSVLQCVAVRHNMLLCVAVMPHTLSTCALYCVLQRVAVWCSV